MNGRGRRGRMIAGIFGGYSSLIEAGGITIANDMDGGVAAIDDAMGNGVDFAIEFDTARLVFELIAQQTQQRDDPLIAGFAGGNRISFQGFKSTLENAPVILSVGPGTGNLVLDLDIRGKPEIGRALADSVFEPVEDVGREDGAFDADAGVVHILTANVSARVKSDSENGD